MIDRLADQALLLEPCACAAVKQRAVCRRHRALQALAQKVPKQVMVAIPVPVVVQADQKQVGLIQVFQQRLCIVLARHRSAERPTQARQDRRLHQEGAHSIGLVLKHLIGQIVEHIGVAAGEVGEKMRDLRGILLLERERGELQASGPPFGACLQGRHGI